MHVSAEKYFTDKKTVHFVKLRGEQNYAQYSLLDCNNNWYMGTNIFEIPTVSIFSVKLPEDGCSRSASNTVTHLSNYTALHLGQSSNPKNVCSITLYLPQSSTFKMAVEGPTNPDTSLPNHTASHPIQSNHHRHHCEKSKSYKISYVCM